MGETCLNGHVEEAWTRYLPDIVIAWEVIHGEMCVVDEDGLESSEVRLISNGGILVRM